MARVTLDIGAQVDLLSQAELDESLTRSHTGLVMSWLQGIRYIRLPRLTGTAAGGVLTLGYPVQMSGPRPGWAWSVLRITVTGLTAGTTPDVVTISRDGGDPCAQVTGNQPVATFSRLQFVLLGGEVLSAASAGTFAATGTVTVTGEGIEVPEEMLGKLA